MSSPRTAWLALRSQDVAEGMTISSSWFTCQPVHEASRADGAARPPRRSCDLAGAVLSSQPFRGGPAILLRSAAGRGPRLARATPWPVQGGGRRGPRSPGDRASVPAQTVRGPLVREGAGRVPRMGRVGRAGTHAEAARGRLGRDRTARSEPGGTRRGPRRPPRLRGNTAPRPPVPRRVRRSVSGARSEDGRARRLGASLGLDSTTADLPGTRVPPWVLRVACEGLARPDRPGPWDLTCGGVEAPPGRGTEAPRGDGQRTSVTLYENRPSNEGAHSFRASFAFGRSSRLPHFRQRVARIAFRA